MYAVSQEKEKGDRAAGNYKNNSPAKKNPKTNPNQPPPECIKEINQQ